MKTIPFWIDDYPRPVDLPVSPLPTQVDVAIVGGGYTGLSAARTLAKGGAGVAVLEQGQIGHGASSKNGGQVGPGVKLDIQKAFRQFGPEVGREVWQATLDALDFVETLLTDEGIECDYARNGTLVLAHRAVHYEAMVDKAEWFEQELDFHDFELLPPARMREEIGSDVFHGARIDHTGASLQPAKYVFGLAQAAARAGACLCEQTEVLTVGRVAGNSGFRIMTSRGELKATEILLATNGYTGPLSRKIQRQVFPVGSYMITTEPLPVELQQDLNPHKRVMHDTKWLLNYFRLTPDGRTTMGGRNNLSPDLDVVESAHRLTQRLHHIFPQLKQVPITHTWTGQLGITFDLMPHAGQIDGIHYALGYGGHGVAFSAYLGHEMAEVISGQRQRSVFAEIPQATSIFYHGKAWFLPFAAAYYRFLDSVS